MRDVKDSRGFKTFNSFVLSSNVRIFKFLMGVYINIKARITPMNK